jgi:type VI secretion system secreted protein Hcp
MHDISVTKFVDVSSCALMLHCANGKHIPDALITVRKAGEKPVEYLKIKLTELLVSGVQIAGHGSDLLTENVTLNFAKVQVTYMEQDEKGGGKAGGEMGWDVKKNEKM